MMSKKRSDNGHEGLIKGIVAAHSILLLHLLMIGALGLTIVFLTGLVQYMGWIVLGGLTILSLWAYLIYRRVRKEGKNIGQALQAPMFQGREVEIRLLGGFASLKLGKPEGQALESGGYTPPAQLESPDTERAREIAALAQLLEKNLITREEFDQAKRQLLQ
jgi:hypothetical protein